MGGGVQTVGELEARILSYINANEARAKEAKEADEVAAKDVAAVLEQDLVWEEGVSRTGPKQTVREILGPRIDADLEADLAGEIAEKLDEVAKRAKAAAPNLRKYAGLAAAALNSAGFSSDQLVATFFDVFALMALIIELSQKQRNIQRKVRMIENEAIVESLEKQAKLMTDAADEKMKGAIIQAAVQIAMGALNIAGSVTSGMTGMKACKDFLGGKMGPKAQAKMDMGLKNADMQGGAFKGAAEIGGAIGSIFSAIYQGRSERLTAQATKEQANQKRAELALQDATEGMQQAQAPIDMAVKMWERVAQSRLELMRAIHFS